MSANKDKQKYRIKENKYLRLNNQIMWIKCDVMID